MKTKLGIHVASSKRNGAGDLLAAGAALVACVDQNMIGEAHQAGAIVAFRTKRFEDNPAGIDHETLSNIPSRAFGWMKNVMPVWKKNAGADYYLLNNEWDIGTLGSGAAINLFAHECMKIADTMGFKLGIFNFSTGCPSDDPVDGRACTMEQRLQSVLPAIAYATEHGHALSVHVHAIDHGDLQTTGEAIALRHERLLRYCRQQGFAPKVLITELSNGVGGVEPNPQRWLASIEWWDRAVRASEFADQIVGGALYGFNAAETFSKSIIPHIVKIMQANSEAANDPIVTFRGTCPQSLFDALSARVVTSGGTIERLH